MIIGVYRGSKSNEIPAISRNPDLDSRGKLSVVRSKLDRADFFSPRT